MRRRLLHVLAALCAVGSLQSLLPVSADDLSNAQANQAQLGQSIARDKARLAELQAQQASVQAQMQVLTSLIANAEQHLANQNAILDAIVGQIEDTQRHLAETRQHLVARQEILNKRTRNLYKTGGDASFMDSLFTSATFSQLLDRFLVMRDVTHADQVLVQQVQADRNTIEQLAAQQARQKESQQQVIAGIREEEVALRGQYVQQNALNGQLQATKLSLQQRAAASEQALVAVGAQIAALQEARKRAHSSGVFAWPGVQGPITQTYGCTDFGGEPSPPSGITCPSSGSCTHNYYPRGCFHTGIDIAGPYGAEITAADGGIVYTYSGGSGYGNHIIMIHSNGFSSLYGHLSSFAVASGTSVAKGQRIGYEGSSGFSTGAHLHFEIRLNNDYQDPCRYVGC
ncbi:MAG: murein hydrolase activator EnvC [Candidatus Dormibacteria bacterium]